MASYSDLYEDGASRTKHRRAHRRLVSKVMRAATELNLDLDPDPAVTWRERLALWVATSAIAQAWDAFQLVISIFACASYVWQTYLDKVPGWLEVVDIVLVALFVIDYVLQYSLARYKVQFIFSWPSIVDLLAIAPILILLASRGEQGSNYNFFRVFRTLRSLRILRVYRLFSFRLPNDVFRRALVLFVTVICLIFCGAGIFQVLEEEQDLSFHESAYFLVVTLSTVGYGDIQPTNWRSQYFIVLTIMLGLVFVPGQASALYTLFSHYSVYSHRSYTSPHAHIVVAGSITTARVRRFVSEFYHSDHGKQLTRCVVLHHHPPDSELAALLSSPFYQQRVEYIQGSVLRSIDLRRVQAENADGCFVLTDLYDSSPEEADIATVLRASSIKRYAPDRTLYVELHRLERKRHLSRAGVEHIICLEELKLSILARSCTCQGAFPLVTNLVTSHVLPDEDAPAAESPPDSWRAPYLAGAAHEFYTIRAPASLGGLSFGEAALALYREHHVILVACEVLHGKRYIVVNPGRAHTINEDDYLYIIAEDEVASLRLQSVGSSPGASKPTRSEIELTAMGSLDESDLRTLPNEDDEDDEMLDDTLTGRRRTTSRSVLDHDVFHRLLDAQAERSDQYKDHVLVCGSISASAAYVFTLALRASDADRKIVFLGSKLPSKRHLLHFDFDGVAFEQGSPLDRHDLVLAGVRAARVVVILTNPEESPLVHEDPYMHDSASLMTLFEVESLVRAGTPVFVDLVHRSSSRFLRSSPSFCPFDLSPPYVGGQVYVSQFLAQSLVVQAFYVPSVLQLVRMLIAPSLFALPDDVSAMQSNLVKIAVPEGCKTFMDAMEKMVPLDVLPIAVDRWCGDRNAFRDIDAGRRRRPSTLPPPPTGPVDGFYNVCTCPPPDLELTSRDRLLVLRTRKRPS